MRRLAPTAGADFIAETDWVVEQVLAQLKQSGVDDNTMVIFSADNGFASYVRIPKMFEAGYRPSGKWRNGKGNLYEGGHRVPFLVRWPGKVKPGSRCDTTICQTDLYATFAEIMANKDTIPVSAAVDSFTFASSLKGETRAIRPFTIHHSLNGNFAIRQGDWKLQLTDRPDVRWSLPHEKGLKTPAKVVQLYNLKDDPGETKNLEDAYPEKIQELVDELAKAMRDGRTTPGPVQENEGWPYKTGKRSSDVQKIIVEQFPQLGGE
jgi:arylsulfatase A